MYMLSHPSVVQRAYAVNKPTLEMIKLRLAQGYTIFDSGAIPTSILSQGLCYFPLNQVI